MRTKLVAAALLAAACGSHAGDDAPSQSADVVSACDGSTDAAPDDLACTGLYTDVASKTLSPRVHEFAPARAFWSDGADKTRWIDLPDGTTIDASKADDWSFPVGTKAWKEIRASGQRVETRFFWKVRDDRWLHAAYLWSPDGASAHRVDGADTTVNGTPWHVPTSTECDDCHKGRKDRLLGFEAISLGLDGATGWNLAALAAENRLAPPPKKTSLAIADD
ncbi:MAG TPA: hypothetical protein VIF62_06650, partial [Labilithrix sp.]